MKDLIAARPRSWSSGNQSVVVLPNTGTCPAAGEVSRDGRLAASGGHDLDSVRSSSGGGGSHAAGTNLSSKTGIGSAAAAAASMALSGDSGGSGGGASMRLGRQAAGGRGGGGGGGNTDLLAGRETLTNSNSGSGSSLIKVSFSVAQRCLMHPSAFKSFIILQRFGPACACEIQSTWTYALRLGGHGKCRQQPSSPGKNPDSDATSSCGDEFLNIWSNVPATA